MNFTELAQTRQSCRSYDAVRAVEEEKLDAVLQAARLAPSACNGQPYHLTVCRGEAAKDVAAATQSMGMNKFASQAPVVIVISEQPYVKTAALGAKVKGNDYRSIDIGIAAAYLTAEATAQGLSTWAGRRKDSPRLQAGASGETRHHAGLCQRSRSAAPKKAQVFGAAGYQAVLTKSCTGITITYTFFCNIL